MRGSRMRMGGPFCSTRTRQISEATEIPVADLKRALQSLACAKFKILRKEPVGRDVDDTDSFSFNEEFSAKQLRFKVGTVSAQKENEAEKQETRQKVDEGAPPPPKTTTTPRSVARPQSLLLSPAAPARRPTPSMHG